MNLYGDWGLGIGDWGLGVWGLGYGPHPPIPNPQSPIPNPHNPHLLNYKENYYKIISIFNIQEN
jgi:hypothetical protein